MYVNIYITYADATENNNTAAAAGAREITLAEPVEAGVVEELVPLPPEVGMLLGEPPDGPPLEV
jgi:hypothetical protein